MPGPVPLAHEIHGPEGGFPVVLLHGFPLDRSMWRFQAAPLAEAGYRVILPDLRGHGGSPPGEGPSTMGAMADDVVALLDDLRVNRFVLGGFSMGGYVAFEVYPRMESRIAGMVLADTRAEADTEDGRRRRQELARRARREGMQVLVDAFLPRMLTRATRTGNPSLVEEVRRIILGNPPEGAARALLGMAERRDQTPLLEEIRVPALVLVGDEDELTPIDVVKTLNVEIVGSQWDVIRNAGHLTPMEQPAAFNEDLLNWLPMAAEGIGEPRRTPSTSDVIHRL